MPVYMDDIVEAGGIAEKRDEECAKMKKEKKTRYGLKKTKHIMVKTVKETENSEIVHKTET